MKKIVRILYLVLFIIILFSLNKNVYALTIEDGGADGTSTASSDVFYLTYENGDDLTTNSNYRIWYMWVDTSGVGNIVIRSNKHASGSHTPQEITVSGNTVENVNMYTSYTITERDGNIITLESGKNVVYYVVPFDYENELAQLFNISITTDSSRYNIDETAKADCSILVQHDINGALITDWDQSRRGARRRALYTMSSKEFDNYLYGGVEIKVSSGTLSGSEDSSINVSEGGEPSTVIFHYYEPNATFSLNVQNSWNDENNQNEKRPSKVRLVLTKNGVETDNYYDMDTATESTYTFTGLNRFDSEGKIIHYDVVEKGINPIDLAYYDIESEGDIFTGYRISNTYKNVDYTAAGMNIDQSGTDSVSSEKEPIKYKLSFKSAVIARPADEISLTLVDTLPLELDTAAQNDLNGGTYDPDAKTITWQVAINPETNVATWPGGETETIDLANLELTRNLSLNFIGIKDLDGKEIENKAKGTLTINGDVFAAEENTIKTAIKFKTETPASASESSSSGSAAPAGGGGGASAPAASGGSVQPAAKNVYNGLLPRTGSITAFLVTAIGFICIVASIVLKKRNHSKRRK